MTRLEEFDCGIMITASHNPYYDNGIKIINRHGEKLDDATASLIEKYIDGDLSALGIEGDDLPYATGEHIGRIYDYTAGRNRYIGYLISLASHSHKKLRIGLDTANGASWSIARAVFDALGAELYLTGNEPNGTNINNGVGSTHIENLVSLVKKHRLDVGFAYDGDADRCIAVDERGEVVDGDKIMYILAMRLKSKGALKGNTLVATIMSNFGLFSALDEAGIGYEKTTVGDRFVYERMQEGDFSLGGEQSGHIIIRKYATTGDGILTSLMICEELLDKKETLSRLSRPVILYPQVTVNLRIDDRDRAMNDPKVRHALHLATEKIGDSGRILLRKSGTEPVLRIMAECETEQLCHKHISTVREALREGGYINE